MLGIRSLIQEKYTRCLIFARHSARQDWLHNLLGPEFCKTKIQGFCSAITVSGISKWWQQSTIPSLGPFWLLCNCIGHTPKKLALAGHWFHKDTYGYKEDFSLCSGEATIQEGREDVCNKTIRASYLPFQIHHHFYAHQIPVSFYIQRPAPASLCWHPATGCWSHFVGSSESWKSFTIDLCASPFSLLLAPG